jgi:ParB/RepB/Spo0J family partition protein
MVMSEQALENDRNSGFTLVPLKDIFADPEFNCRGTFTADKIIELANDVAARGLLNPITVRVLWDNESEIMKRGYKYSLVAGFRRYSSYRANDADVIPANIKDVKTDFECRDINAVENLQREQLTFWQEARSIRHYWLADWKREEVARRVNKSPGWVQQRYVLLGMEDEIQQAAEQGYITPTDLREIGKFSGIERLQVAGRIRDARKRGETRNVAIKHRKKDQPSEAKQRKLIEVEELMELIRVNLAEVDRDNMVLLSDWVTPQGNSIITRVLAWSCGHATNLDLHLELRDFFKACGVVYVLPDFEMTELH